MRDASECLRRSASIYLNHLHQPNLAATRLERSGELLSKDPTPTVWMTAIDDYAQAGQCYAEAGSTMRGGAVTLMGARLAAKIDPSRALQLYDSALELYGLEENDRLAADAYVFKYALEALLLFNFFLIFNYL